MFVLFHISSTSEFLRSCEIPTSYHITSLMDKFFASIGRTMELAERKMANSLQLQNMRKKRRNWRRSMDQDISKVVKEEKHVVALKASLATSLKNNILFEIAGCLKSLHQKTLMTSPLISLYLQSLSQKTSWNNPTSIELWRLKKRTCQKY